MYCSTCGSRVPEGRSSCDTCGAPVRFAVRPASRFAGELSEVGEGGRPVAGAAVAACPRCGYRGQGLPYFSRGTHIAALVGATVLTAGAMGAGGLVYYIARREHRVCPRCGRGWGKYGERVLVRPNAAGGAPLPSAARESAKRGWSILLFVLAAILMVGGIADFEIAAILLSLVAAGGGLVLQRAAARERLARREALLASLQLPVLKLAGQHGGRLTVSEVAAELGWTLRRAEKVLQSMEDGLRVNSDVTDEGVIVYEFRELMHSPNRALEPPEDHTAA